MEEGNAAAFYDEQRNLGSGAARFKHGLGYDGVPAEGLPGPPHPHPGPPRPHQGRPPPGHPHHMGRDGPPLPPPPGQPPTGGPPGGPGRPMLPPQGMMMPPPGARPPYPYPPFPMPPGAQPQFVRGPMPPMPPHPGAPPHGGPPPGMWPMMRPPAAAHVPPPQPPAPRLGGGPLPPPGGPVPPPRPPPPLPTALTPEEEARARVEAEVQQAAAAEERRRREEEARKRAEEEADRIEAEAEARRVLAGWTAHKAEDGQLYYYNTVTQESSWSRPEGFSAGEAEEVAEQPRPVASVAVEGTGWAEVKCSDGRTYYYHGESGESSWSVPPEVAAAKADARQREAERLQARLQAATSSSARLEREKADEAARREAVRKRSSGVLPPNMSKAQRVAMFKELLLDKGVTPFSRWEREVPKLEADPRWEALATLKERRAAFDEFCKATAAEQKRMREQRAKSVVAGFQELLAEADALERRLLLDSLREQRAEALAVEEGEAPAEGAVEGGDKEGAAAGPNAGAAEVDEEAEAERRAGEEAAVAEAALDISLEHLERYWGNDPRWKETDAKQREQLFEERFGAMVRRVREEREARAAALRRDYTALLQERGVGSGSRWSKTKEALAADPRFLAVPPAEREPWFRSHVAQLQEAEDKAAAAEEARRAKEEAAVAKLAAKGEEAEARRRAAAHADAVAGLRTLLGEVVKDPEARWADWQARLEKDPQERATNPALKAGEAEEVFRAFTRDLLDASTAAFRALLTERLAPLMPPAAEGPTAPLPAAVQQLEAAAELLEDDLRWARAPASLRERLWRRGCEELIVARNRELGIEPPRHPDPPPPGPPRRPPGDDYGRPGPPGPPPQGHRGDYRADGGSGGYHGGHDRDRRGGGRYGYEGEHPNGGRSTRDDYRGSEWSGGGRDYDRRDQGGYDRRERRDQGGYDSRGEHHRRPPAEPERKRARHEQ